MYGNCIVTFLWNWHNPSICRVIQFKQLSKNLINYIDNLSYIFNTSLSSKIVLSILILFIYVLEPTELVANIQTQKKENLFINIRLQLTRSPCEGSKFIVW